MSIVRSLMRPALALVLLIGLAGCYQTEHEIFGPKEAAIIPGLAGRYSDGHGEWIITPIRHTPDYSVRNRSNPQDPPLRFRAVALGNDVYIMQLQVDPKKPNVYWHIVFRVMRKNGRIDEITQLEPDDDAVKARVQQLSSVTLNPPPAGSLGDPETVVGPADAVASLIKSIATLPTKTETVFRRVN